MTKFVTFSAIFLMLAIFLAVTPSEVDGYGRKYQLSVHGACSARLMDTLQFVCGRQGFNILRNLYIFRRYRPHYIRMRRNGGMLRRHRRYVHLAEEEERITKSSKFHEALSQTYGMPLSSLVEVGNEFNVERNHRRRFRRQIAHECCENNCDFMQIRHKYCKKPSKLGRA